MANTITPVDVYSIMNEVVEQATGRKDLAVVDTSTFVSVGETLLRTSPENTLNAISTVLARTIFSIRPYKAKLESLKVSAERWGAMTRKIVYLYNEAEKTTDWNTDGNSQQLADGSSVDHYKINAPKAMQLNFYGTKLLQKSITRFRDQLSLAFRNEAEFMGFIDGVMIEFQNEIEMLNEAETRATLINHMAGMQAMGLEVVDLIAEFNKEKGTSYTRDEVLNQHLQEFIMFVSPEIKTYSDKMTDNTAKFHAQIAGKKAILRHTPKERQKMIMYAPLFRKIEGGVYPSLFDPKYLNIGDFEGVNYWQDFNDPTAIQCKPNILDVATGESKTGDETKIPYVMGILFDEEALGVQPQFEYSATTPFNAAGGYVNLFVHWRFNAYNDFTENAVLFILGDGGSASSKAAKK